MANRAQRRAQAREQARLARIKEQITNEAIDKASILTAEQQTSWILSAVILFMHKKHKWGTQRCLQLLKGLDEFFDEIVNDNKTIDDLVQEVEDELSIRLTENPNAIKEFYKK